MAGRIPRLMIREVGFFAMVVSVAGIINSTPGDPPEYLMFLFVIFMAGLSLISVSFVLYNFPEDHGAIVEQDFEALHELPRHGRIQKLMRDVGLLAMVVSAAGLIIAPGELPEYQMVLFGMLMAGSSLIAVSLIDLDDFPRLAMAAEFVALVLAEFFTG